MYDDETGLYYLKSRYYSPALGRFLTRDGIKYMKRSNPQTLNLYSYCENNPVSFTDPNGNIVTDWDKLFLNPSELKDVKDASDAWTAANKRGDKAGMAAAHAKAVAARSHHTSSNQTIDSSGYVHGYTVPPSRPSESIPSQIWKGMSDEGWKPYKQTAGAVLIGGGVVVTGGLAGGAITTADSLAVIGYTATDVFISPPPPGTPGGGLIYQGTEWVFTP